MIFYYNINNITRDLEAIYIFTTLIKKPIFILDSYHKIPGSAYAPNEINQK